MNNPILYDASLINIFYTHEIYDDVEVLFESNSSNFDPEQYYEALHAINNELEQELLYSQINQFSLNKINNIINQYLLPIIEKSLNYKFLIPNTYEHKLFCEYYNLEKTKQYYVVFFTNTIPMFLYP